MGNPPAASLKAANRPVVGFPWGDSPSVVQQLSWHLHASAWCGVYSEKRRKDVLRLQFGAHIRSASSVVRQEIAALDPLSRSRHSESPALRAFRRSLSGPRFRKQFEDWYARCVDHAPLRTFVATLPDDTTKPAEIRDVALATNGKPRQLSTLSLPAQRDLIRRAIAEVIGKTRAQLGRQQSREAGRQEVARLLGLSSEALHELERGRAR